MLQKLCILLLGYLGYLLYKKVMNIDDRVKHNEDEIETCHHNTNANLDEITKLNERASV